MKNEFEVAETLSPLNSTAVDNFLKREAERKKPKPRLVCVCGHSINYHGTVKERGVTVCKPGRIDCKCSEERPVLETKNLRVFLNNTSGAGVEHALGKGLVSAVRNGVEFEWVESPLKCDKCMGLTSEPIPIAVNLLSGVPTDVSTGIDKIVCPACYLELLSGAPTPAAVTVEAGVGA